MRHGKFKKYAITLIVLAVLGGGSYWGWGALHPAKVAVVRQTSIATMGEVHSTVSASGKVVSPGDIGISPTINGVLTSLYVKVGDHVSAGQILAQLDSSSAKNTLVQASTTLTLANGALAKLTPVRTVAEQVQMDLQLQQSQAAIDVATQYLSTLQASSTTNSMTYDSAILAAKKALIDAQALVDSNAASYQANTNAAKAALDFAQVNGDTYYNTWSRYGFTFSYCQNAVIGADASIVSDALGHCQTILANVNALAAAKIAYSAAQVSQATNLKRDAQNIATLQFTYDQALASKTLNVSKDSSANAQAIQAAKNAVSSAETSYNLLKQQFAVALQEPRQVDLNAASAAIILAQSNYQLARLNLAATVIRSPVSGDVASISGMVGSIPPTTATSANSLAGIASGFIVLTNVSALRVQAGFSEADTARLRIGQSVAFTFAALPDAKPHGKVAQIGLLPSLTAGATIYLVTFNLDSRVAGLKPGMSSTAIVTTDLVRNVLRVSPSTLTFGDNNNATVNVVTTVNGKEVTVSTPVLTGLQGDTSVQILSGIKAGVKLALPNISSSVGSSGFPTVGIPAVSGAGGFLNGGG